MRKRKRENFKYNKNVKGSSGPGYLAAQRRNQEQAILTVSVTIAQIPRLYSKYTSQAILDEIKDEWEVVVKPDVSSFVCRRINTDFTSSILWTLHYNCSMIRQLNKIWLRSDKRS